jgi:hypothetical protein
MTKMISNIVFTKNRPLQLDGYLQSLYRHLPAELIRMYVLYKPELFKDEYRQLFSKYSNCIVIKEDDFYSDFLKIIDQIDTKFILFGIDDVVYFDSVSFEVIEQTFDLFSEDIFGFSLRLGKDYIEMGGDPIEESSITGQTVYRLDWRKGRTPTSRYPFELCATVYRTSLVKKIIHSARKDYPLLEKLFAPSSPIIQMLSRATSTRSILKRFGYFFNPNTLESWNCRWSQNHSHELPGFLFFQKQCATAIQVNMVNTSTVGSKFCGYRQNSVEVLADKYKQGYRLDIDRIARNKPSGIQSGPEYFMLIRNEALPSV